MNPNILNQIRNFVTQIVDMPDEQLNEWVKISKRSVLYKGDYFCTPDKPSTKLGYITRGLLRYFVIDRKGRDRTLGFGGEDVVVSSYSAVVWNRQDFLMYDAKTRYQIFLEDFPQYRNRIKQEHIASYLGISPETLSRVKLDK